MLVYFRGYCAFNYSFGSYNIFGFLHIKCFFPLHFFVFDIFDFFCYCFLFYWICFYVNICFFERLYTMHFLILFFNWWFWFFATVFAFSFFEQCGPYTFSHITFFVCFLLFVYSTVKLYKYLYNSF